MGPGSLFQAEFRDFSPSGAVPVGIPSRWEPWECSEEREGIARTGERKIPEFFLGGGSWPGARQEPEAPEPQLRFRNFPWDYFWDVFLTNSLFGFCFLVFLGSPPVTPIQLFQRNLGIPKTPNPESGIPLGSSQIFWECENPAGFPLMINEPLIDETRWNSKLFLGSIRNFLLPALEWVLKFQPGESLEFRPENLWKRKFQTLLINPKNPSGEALEF